MSLQLLSHGLVDRRNVCSIPGRCRRTLSSPERQTGSGACQTCRMVMRIISPEKKRSKCTSYSLLPCNGKIKKAWSYNSTPPVFKPSCLIQHKANLTFTPLYITVTFTSWVYIAQFVLSVVALNPKYLQILFNCPSSTTTLRKVR
jgi:hypothetical protein